MYTSGRAGIVAIALAALLTSWACQNTGGDATPRRAAPPPDEGAVAGAVLYEVVTDESLILIKVYRGGTLARLGHNHVVAAHDLSGQIEVAPSPLDSRMRLRFSKRDLTVDEPALRAAAGEAFAAEVPADAVAGTRENMLGPRLLDAVNYPLVEVRADQMDGALPQVELRAWVRVLDVELPVTFPADVRLDGSRLTAAGSRRVTHAELGLEPFSVMLGALRVDDEIELQYTIVAERAD